MKHESFNQYLDHPTRLPEDPDERALAELLAEAADLETPDPGQDYWNQFNSRLQARLDEKPAPRFNWRMFLALGGAGLTAAALLLVFLPLGTTDERGLETLDHSSLVFLSEVYSDYADDTASISLGDSEADLLIETYEFEDEGLLPLNDEWAPLDAEALKAMWKEG